jgi:hypothetical protein
MTATVVLAIAIVTGPAPAMAAIGDTLLGPVGALAAPLITGGPTGSGTTATPSWTFSVVSGATAQCQLERSGWVVSAYRACTSPVSFNLSATGEGTYTLRVRAVAILGGLSPSASVTYTFTSPVTVPPVLAPILAPVLPGPSVTVPTVTVPPVTVPPGVLPPVPVVPTTLPPTVPPAVPTPSVPETSALPESPHAPGAPAATSETTSRASAAGETASPKRVARQPEAEIGGASLAGAKRLRDRSWAQKASDSDPYRMAAAVSDKVAFPVALVFVAIAFLMAQNRIDRNDPKLARAPVHAEPDLPFRERPSF